MQCIPDTRPDSEKERALSVEDLTIGETSDRDANNYVYYQSVNKESCTYYDDKCTPVLDSTGTRFELVAGWRRDYWIIARMEELPGWCHHGACVGLYTKWANWTGCSRCVLGLISGWHRTKVVVRSARLRGKLLDPRPVGDISWLTLLYLSGEIVDSR